MNKIITIITTCILIVGCSPTMPKATPILVNPETPISTTTLEPTKTATTEPTPTQIPLEGLLFLDMNGSGLRDEASFNYDATRLTDERQPLQADLLAAITAHMAEHSDIKDGDLVTLEEPGLSGYTVCAMSNCVTTDAEGKFQLLEPDIDRFLNITIKDPNVGSPALEMRYINKWKREVAVPEYTKDIDATTMVQLMAVPACDADLAAQVCKKDADTLLVREQHLNDTSIFELGDGATLQPGSPNEIGLMQGFLTLPYSVEDKSSYKLENYVDLNPLMGDVINYSGNTQLMVNPHLEEGGTTDNHPGLDYRANMGNNVLASVNGTVGYVNTNKVGIFYQNESKQVNNGHMSLTFVGKAETVYRGMFISTIGSTNTNHPHNHFALYDLQIIDKEGWPAVLDPYGDLVNQNDSCLDYTGIIYEHQICVGRNGYWTVYNFPIFP